ncbi:Secreted peptide, partial [Phytophthora megakarya]
RYVGIQVGSAVEPSYTWKVAGQQLETRLRLASQNVLTVDQRSLIASAIITPKLLYVARHAWPTTADVNAMNARIKNYVWHGQFTNDVQGARAWLDADLAALPRTNGGLAIPDLRTELYAMAAVTVSKWAELGTTQAHIVGDVLFHNTNAGVAPTVFITPEYTPPRSGGVRRRRTLWDTGRALLTEAGAPNPADAATPLRTGCSVAAFAVGGITATWTGDTLSADCSFLLTALATTDREENPLADGSLHLEWLPYAELDTLQITTMDGLRHSLSGACGGIGAPHTILRDIIRWRKVERNVIAFEFNNSTVPRAPSKEQAEILVLTLLMNLQAAPADHPVLASLCGCVTIEMVIQSDTAGTTSIDSVLALTTHLANFLKPNIIVKTVHPHPKLSRLVCLWAGRRRWTRHRREYKARIEEAKTRRGIEKLKSRRAQWAAHSQLQLKAWRNWSGYGSGE